MKLFITGGYNSLIEEIEATRISASSYWTTHNGRDHRHALRSSYKNAWISFDEAKAYLIEKTERNIRNTKANLKDLEDRLTEIQRLNQ